MKTKRILEYIKNKFLRMEVIMRERWKEGK